MNRMIDGLLHYSVVNEYDCPEYMLWRTSSRKPFTLRKLIEFLDNSTGEEPDSPVEGGLSLSHNNFLVDYSTRSELENFTTISSEIYPELQEHYTHVFSDWAVEEEEEAQANACET